MHTAVIPGKKALQLFFWFSFYVKKTKKTSKPLKKKWQCLTYKNRLKLLYPVLNKFCWTIWRLAELQWQPGPQTSGDLTELLPISALMPSYTSTCQMKARKGMCELRQPGSGSLVPCFFRDPLPPLLSQDWDIHVLSQERQKELHHPSVAPSLLQQKDEVSMDLGNTCLSQLCFAEFCAICWTTYI